MHTRGKTETVPADPKAQLRAAVLAARRITPAATRNAEAVALTGHLGGVVHTDDVVCAYVPVRTEPGSMDLVDRLHLLCARLLLPVARTGAGGEPLPLLWGEYTPGALTVGTFDLREPAEPWLPASTLAEASIVLIPALAVDRRGTRLGRGGGFYDRSLALYPPGGALVAVVRDSEVVHHVPDDPHDIPMTHALTPVRGLINLK